MFPSRNEYHALLCIAKKTTIPVPKVIDWSEKQDGSRQLVTERIDGVTRDEIEDEKHQLALKMVEKELHDSILPQLRNLHRDYVGSVSESLPVIPPLPAIESKDNTNWPRIRSARPEFVFCHSDLGQHNIMVDPESYKIKAVIDWEYSGFFPKSFEATLWKTKARDRDLAELRKYTAETESFFGV